MCLCANLIKRQTLCLNMFMHASGTLVKCWVFGKKNFNWFLNTLQVQSVNSISISVKNLKNNLNGNKNFFHFFFYFVFFCFIRLFILAMCVCLCVVRFQLLLLLLWSRILLLPMKRNSFQYGKKPFENTLYIYV